MAGLPISSWAIWLIVFQLALISMEAFAQDCGPLYSNGTCPEHQSVVSNASGEQCCLQKTQNSTSIVAIVVPVVVGGLALLVALPIAIYCFIKVRNKRRDEGTYNPNMQEKSSVAQTGPPGGLQRPPEERLI